jgi:Asp-tRNA(Asn)/Glu-tRNA(Gln) amidotransferase A subunit family amidase
VQRRDGRLVPGRGERAPARLQQTYAEYFADTTVDAILFPTSPVLPAPIDEANGSGTLSIDGGDPVDTFTTTIRNMTPGSCAGVPSLALPAGTAPGGLPVGISLDGPVGSDRRVLATGMAVQSVLGSPPRAAALTPVSAAPPGVVVAVQRPD